MKKHATIVITFVVLLFFRFRDWACRHFYPEMRTVTGDWDGANSLTMNTYSCIIGLCFVLARLYCENKKLNFFLVIVIGYSASDILDRLYFDIAEYTKEDVIMEIATITFAIIDYCSEQIHAYLLNFKLYSAICSTMQKLKKR